MWQDKPLRLADMRRISTFRLTAILGAVFLAAMVALLGLIYLLTERELTGRTDQVLAQEARTIMRAHPDHLPATVRAAIAANASRLNYYALLRPDGTVVVGNFPPPARLAPGQPLEVPASRDVPVPLRVIAVRLGDGGRLLVARDISQIVDLRRQMVSILMGSGIGIAVVVALAAIVLSIGPARRIRHLTAVARRIAAGELGLRMPLSARGDELDLVAATINTMMAEIVALMAQVKGATDAIAHDLRAPLAHVRDRLDRIQRQAAPPPYGLANLEGAGRDNTSLPVAAPDAATTIAMAVEELDQVLTRFNALLRIAELEATNRRAGFGPLDPMALVAQVCELFEPLAEERSIHLGLAGAYGLTIQGDERLLFEALSNLLDNALKFTPPGGAVILSAEADQHRAGGVIMGVRDNGPGIPAAERATVLRRFHRGTTARATPGSGLGLSLVAAIAHLHGFDLELEDADPGLAVHLLCLPDPPERAAV